MLILTVGHFAKCNKCLVHQLLLVGNTVNHSHAYDQTGRGEVLQETQVAGQTQVSYTYDNADRLTGVTQGSASVTLAYDDADRRTSLTLPNGIVVEYALGLLAAGMPAEALESFRRGNRLALDDIDAGVGIAAALSTIGQHSAAIQAFHRALTRSPDVLDNRPELRSMFESSRRAVNH